MRRRVATAVVCVAALLVSAAPAQAGTTFTLIGHGWGHGIGMSQWGSYGYASHGWTYRQILAHYYKGTAIGQVPVGTTERVLMMDGKPSVTFGAAAAMKVTPAGAAAVSLPAGTYRIEPGTTPGYERIWSLASSAYVLSGLAAPVLVSPSSQPLLLVNATYRGFANDHWHGSLRFLRGTGGILPVNVVGLDNYAAGIAPCEESPSWPVEALKAQAVAARSYAYRTRNTDQSVSVWDTKDDVANQTYCPIEREGANSIAAVSGTSREIVTYGGSVAATFYSASSGGRTSSMQASWGSSFGYPYLVPVDDTYDAAGGLNPNHTWAPKVYGPTTLAQAFGLGGAISAVDNHIDAPSYRILSLTLHTPSGTSVTKTSGQAFSALSLRSTYFRLLGLTLTAPARVANGTTFSVTGRAWPRPTSLRLQVKLDGTTTWLTAPTAIHMAADGTFVVRRVQHHSVSYRLVRASGVSPVVHVTITAPASPHATQMVAGR